MKSALTIELLSLKTGGCSICLFFLDFSKAVLHIDTDTVIVVQEFGVKKAVLTLFLDFWISKTHIAYTSLNEDGEDA